MNKQQTGMILDLIDLTYPGKLKTDNPSVLAATWHNVLQEYEYEFVSENLMYHIKNSPYLPSLHDLVTDKQRKSDGGRYIPSAQETKMMLENKHHYEALALDMSLDKPKDEEILAMKEKALKTIAEAVKKSEENNPYKKEF